jgi:hypothetical protein
MVRTLFMAAILLAGIMTLSTQLATCLKVVGNEKVGGSGMCQTVPFFLSRIAAIDVIFSINFAVVFDLTYFRFRPSKAK